MRAYNLKSVFDYIRRNEPTSRRDVAEHGGLTVATVSNITNRLIENGLVVEIGEGDSFGGRKPTMLGINADCRYAIGIDLTTDYVKLVITNFKAQIIYKSSCDTELHQGYQFVLSKICNFIQSSIDIAQIDRKKIIGIGIVSAGPCDPELGVMQSPPNFHGWNNINIREYIKEHTNYEVVFDKDAVGAVMAEYWFGQVSDCSHIFAVLINHAGVGGGVIANGEVFRGCNGGAGEIGHTIIDVHGKKCSCGDYGCLESVVNAHILVQEIQKNLKLGRQSLLSSIKDFDDVTLNDILAATENGDELCCEKVDEMARYLSVGIRNIATTYAPEKIVLAGSLICKCNYLVQAVLEKTQKMQGGKFVKNLDVLECSFQENQCALGAVALVLDKFYKSIQIN